MRYSIESFHQEHFFTSRIRHLNKAKLRQSVKERITFKNPFENWGSLEFNE